MVEVPTLFAGLWLSDVVYAIPLVLVVSLVYAATRHEDMQPILQHAARLATMISLFMGIIFVVLAILSALV